MFKYKATLMIPICVCIIASGFYCYADEDFEDLIDITESDDKIFGFVASGKSFSFDLKPRESVKWSDSRGYLGAFLTNFHFFVLANKSNSWQVVPLRLNESENSLASLSPTIALLATGHRAIAFDAASNQFIEAQIPIRDDVISAQTGDYVAVVVTSSRVFGVASGSSSFAQIPLKTGETIETVKITSKKATVTTPDRLLIFVAESSTWRKHRLN